MSNAETRLAGRLAVAMVNRMRVRDFDEDRRPLKDGGCSDKGTASILCGLASEVRGQPQLHVIKRRRRRRRCLVPFLRARYHRRRIEDMDARKMMKKEA